MEVVKGGALDYIRDEVIDYEDGFMLERVFYDH